MNTVTTDTSQQINGAAGAATSTPQAPLAKESTAIVPAVSSDGRALSAFSSRAAFEDSQRMARAIASSTLMPTAFQNNIPNVLIAMEMASRIGASVFMVAQNIDIIHGRPSWRAQFLIATVNGSGKFTPIRFRWQGQEGTEEWGCRAVAKERETGEECIGPLINIKMAKAEKWYDKSGSKWQTMPELMMCYRSAAFWTRLYAPELSLGMQTREEVIDTVGYEVPEVQQLTGAPSGTKALESILLGEALPVAPPVGWGQTGVTADGEIVSVATPTPEEPKPAKTKKAREPGED